MKKVLVFIALVYFNCGIVAKTTKPEIANKVKHYHDLFNATDNENISCYRIPAIVTASNGDLVAAIDERVPSCGDLKWSKDINIVVRRSQDNGKIWSDIEMVVDFPFGKSASDPSMIVDEETNEIFLFYNFMDLDIEKDNSAYPYVKMIKEHTDAMGSITRKLMRITKYETQDYIEGSRIIDIDKAAGAVG